MNRRHLLLSGGAIATSAWIGQACQSRTQPSAPTEEASSTQSSATTEESPIVTATNQASQLTMAELVTAFLQTLDPDQQQRAVFPFDSEERLNWHYVPRSRQGIAFKEMSAEQRQACDRLLQFTLSELGYRKLQNILTLETILREMGGSPSIRDPELYFLTVFGDPATAPWGWRMEGHHLSLNLAVIANELITVTPAFWGANPAEVQSQTQPGLRTLPQEQDLAFELLQSLASDQREQIVLANQSFGDILTGPGRAASLAQPVGLLLGNMQTDSRDRAVRLIETYVRNLKDDLADGQWQQIQDAGMDQIRFAWAGALEPGQAHYYRLHGPTTLIEYDNTRNNANHIHTIWRDLTHDFGVDALGAHYQQSIHT